MWLCVFSTRGETEDKLSEGRCSQGHAGLSSSPYLLSLTSRCQITRLQYCLCAGNLTNFEERLSTAPSRLLLSEESLAVCRAPIGETFSALCFASPLLSSPVSHNMQILLFSVSNLQHAYSPTCCRNRNIFCSLILLGISFSSVVDFEFLFQEKVPQRFSVVPSTYTVRPNKWHCIIFPITFLFPRTVSIPPLT